MDLSVKLIDFGAACRTDKSGRRGRRRASCCVGSVQYMAPETVVAYVICTFRRMRHPVDRCSCGASVWSLPRSLPPSVPWQGLWVLNVATQALHTPSHVSLWALGVSKALLAWPFPPPPAPPPLPPSLSMCISAVSDVHGRYDAMCDGMMSTEASSACSDGGDMFLELGGEEGEEEEGEEGGGEEVGGAVGGPRAQGRRGPSASQTLRPGDRRRMVEALVHQVRRLAARPVGVHCGAVACHPL
jgi:serine/threonine protein kinase